MLADGPRCKPKGWQRAAWAENRQNGARLKPAKHASRPTSTAGPARLANWLDSDQRGWEVMRQSQRSQLGTYIPTTYIPTQVLGTPYKYSMTD